MAEGAIVSADAIRGYIRTLRQEEEKTQEDVAEAIRMAVRTYKAWELGKTKDIKTPYLIRAVHFLQGSLDQIADLADDATQEEGAELARRWLSREEVATAIAPTPDKTPDNQARLNQFLALLGAGIDPREAAQTVLREK